MCGRYWLLGFEPSLICSAFEHSQKNITNSLITSIPFFSQNCASCTFFIPLLLFFSFSLLLSAIFFHHIITDHAAAFDFVCCDVVCLFVCMDKNIKTNTYVNVHGDIASSAMHHHRLGVMQVLLDAIVGEQTKQNLHQKPIQTFEINENTDWYLIVLVSSFLLGCL